MKYIFILTIFSLFYAPARAQEAYWQQEVNYEIHVSLDDTAHSLHGQIRIQYINHSPDELTFIKFHLWPNAYKNSSTILCQQMLDMGDKALYYASEQDRGYIDSLDFRDSAGTLKWEQNTDTIDIATIYLNKALKPGDTVMISTPFYVKIPSSDFSRLGHSGQSYQITQWYPKPAVYDRTGWNAIPYLNQGEFYSEFGSFDVYITLPRNYVVGATGDLVNCPAEEQWLDSIAEVTRRKSRYSVDLSFPESDTVLKTLHYHQEKVHDFAWFADKRYHVLKEEVELPSGHKVTTWAMFTNEETDIWTKSSTYLKRSIKFYSQQVGEYPYNQVTAVQGTLSAGAGMEYPNITIIGYSGDAKSLDNVIMHEVGHNWFYGMLGFNERAHPWMDEGLNTYIESLYMDKYYPHARLSDEIGGLNLFHANDYGSMYSYYFANLFQWRRNLNQSLALPAQDFTPMNYGITVYQKTGLIMRYLQAYLGEKKARITMRKFFDQWKYKHPLPEDMKAFWERETGEDLSWLFDDLINSNKVLDYKITGLKKQKESDSVQVNVRNKGKISSPFTLTGIDEAGDVKFRQWYPGFSGVRKISFPKGNYDRISIDGDKVMTDVYRGNDQVHTSGLLKKRKKFRLTFAWTLPKDDRSTLFWTPVIGGNAYNKFMLGAAFYNSLVFEKKWQYMVMPMYSFEQKNINGSFSLFRNFYGKGKLQRVSIGLSGRKYNYNHLDYSDNFDRVFDLSFWRLVPELIFDFKSRKPNLTSVYKHLNIRMVHVEEERVEWVPDGMAASSQYFPTEGTRVYDIWQVKFTHENRRVLNPFSYIADAQFNADFVRLTAEVNYRLSYGKSKSGGFDVRVFGGLLNTPNAYPDYAPNLRMAGTSGSRDYLYDGVFLGRSESSGLWAQQMLVSDGGFYVPTVLGQVSDWMFAVNMRASVPHFSLVRAYFNIGFDQDISGDGTETLWESGFILSIIDRKFEVYFPLLWSQNIQDGLDLNKQDKYGEKIRFTMRLDLANPFKILKNIHI
jgi:hypothetical protein